MLKKLSFGLVSLAFSAVFLCSCTCSKKLLPKNKPEDVVRQFIELSSAVKEPDQKDQLAKLCYGELQRAFERMTAENFKMSYLNQNIRIKGIKFLEEEIKDETARIAYEVRLENLQGSSPTEEINEREVELRQVEAKWLIESIRMKGTDKVAFTRGMIF